MQSILNFIAPEIVAALCLPFFLSATLTIIFIPVRFRTTTRFRTSKTTFRTSETLFRTSEMPFRISETPFRRSETSFRTSETPFRTSETPFRTSEKPFQISETPFRRSEMMFRTPERSFRTSETPFWNPFSYFRTRQHRAEVDDSVGVPFSDNNDDSIFDFSPDLTACPGN